MCILTHSVLTHCEETASVTFSEHLAVLSNAPLAALVVEAADAGGCIAGQFSSPSGKRQSNTPICTRYRTKTALMEEALMLKVVCMR